MPESDAQSVNQHHSPNIAFRHLLPNDTNDFGFICADGESNVGRYKSK